MDNREPKEIITEIIIDCIKTGKKLPSEKELTQKLGISRSRLRELLIEFEYNGMIVATQGSGREVQFPDVSNSIFGGWNILLKTQPKSLLDLLDVRYVLEKGFLNEVIETLTLDDLQMMRDLVNRMIAKAQRNEIFNEEDKMFHRILFSRINNVVLEQLLKAFWDLFAQYESIQRSENLLESAIHHKKLYEAIMIKDIDKAEKMLTIHFEDVRKRIYILVDQLAHN